MVRGIVVVGLLLGTLVTAGPVLACQYDAAVTRAATAAGLPVSAVLAIMHAESSGRAGISGDAGRARGLFQITEPTWRRFSQRPFSAAFEPAENIRVAIAYLKTARTTDAKNLVAYHNAGIRDWRRLAPRWSVNHPNAIYRAIYRAN